VIVHMAEETVRHAGHVEILRELLDGVTADHRRTEPACGRLPSSTAPAPDRP
jgi:hypothetical protein